MIKRDQGMRFADVCEIIDLLKEEKELLNRTLAFSEEKTKSIVEGDASQLKQIVEAEETVMYEFGELEDKRALLTASLAEQTGIAAKQLTLSKIAKMADDETLAKTVRDIQKDFSDLIIKQKKINSMNQKLIKRKMNYIDVMLGALLERDPPSDTYGSCGKMNTCHASAGLFDFSV